MIASHGNNLTTPLSPMDMLVTLGGGESIAAPLGVMNWHQITVDSSWGFLVSILVLPAQQWVPSLTGDGTRWRKDEERVLCRHFYLRDMIMATLSCYVIPILLFLFLPALQGKFGHCGVRTCVVIGNADQRWSSALHSYFHRSLKTSFNSITISSTQHQRALWNGRVGSILRLIIHYAYLYPYN